MNVLEGAANEYPSDEWGRLAAERLTELQGQYGLAKKTTEPKVALAPGSTKTVTAADSAPDPGKQLVLDGTRTALAGGKAK